MFLHDSSEAYTGDINKPLKNLIRSQTDVLERVENSLDAAIALRFRCDFTANHEVIKQADTFMLFTEKRCLFGDREKWAGEDQFIPVFGYDPSCLSVGKAVDVFMSVAQELQVI